MTNIKHKNSRSLTIVGVMIASIWIVGFAFVDVPTEFPDGLFYVLLLSGIVAGVSVYALGIVPTLNIRQPALKIGAFLLLLAIGVAVFYYIAVLLRILVYLI